ncbi:hypothetical protein VTN96DRAFT_4936 [Rasamsonia emersonii]
MSQVQSSSLSSSNSEDRIPRHGSNEDQDQEQAKHMTDTTPNKTDTSGYKLGQVHEPSQEKVHASPQRSELEPVSTSAPSPASTPPDNDDKPSRGRFRVLAIFTALSLSLLIAALDQTIVATVIPTIAADLHSAAGYVWIGGAYLLANAAGANIWANLSDIWGRKPVLLAAVALFFGSSIVCATAVDMTMLIVGRALEGVAGGGLIQLVTITISDLFSVRRRSLYLGLLEFMWAIAGAVGPIMGGALTQAVSWRWIYWINLPVCGTAFLLLLIFLDVHNPRTAMLDGIRAIDWFGSVSILGLTLMLLLGLDFGGQIPWGSPQVICLIVVGCLLSLVFVYCEKRLARYPLMPLGIFKNVSNVACFVVAFSHGMVFIGGEYYLPLYFQSVKEASPLHSGLLILPIVLTESFLSALAGVIIHRTGRYLELIRVGTAFTVLGTGLYIDLDTDSSLGQIIGFQIVAGIGSGLLFSPPLIAMQSNVSQADTAAATATFGFVRNLATASSIVLGGVIFQNSMTLRKTSLRAAGLSPALTEQLAGADAAANVLLLRNSTTTVLGLQQQQRQAIKDAFAWSLRNMWILYMSVAAVGMVASAFVSKQRLSKEHVETKTGIKERERQRQRHLEK